MTEVEKRRVMLLRETRKIYSEKYTPPAIHPRYQSTYNSLYRVQEETGHNNKVFVRILISITIFAVFWMLDLKNVNIDISAIQKSISQIFPTLIKYF